MKRILVVAWCALSCACFNFDDDLRTCYAIGRCVDAGSGFVTGGGGGSLRCSPTASDNITRDTDCDGLSDDDEYNIVWVGGLRTDPCTADTDGDGLLDGLEAGATTSVRADCNFIGDADPTTVTNPIVADTDSDGLSDGEEDTNRDGKRSPREADPLLYDTDCDGLNDKEERSRGDGCITRPDDADSDGDGLRDGLERGLNLAIDSPRCAHSTQQFDLDPSTVTNPCSADTDGDGLNDGLEDGNRNGRVDANEFNPTAADPNVTNKCTVADAAFEWRDEETNLSGFFQYPPSQHTVVSLNGVTLGKAIEFETESTSYAIVLRQPVITPSPTLESEEERWRSEIGGVVEVIGVERTTWRGEPALLGRYRVTGAGATPNDGINTALTQAFGASVVGRLSSPGTEDGGSPSLRFDVLFSLQTRVLTSIAVTPDVWYLDETRRQYAVATSVGRATDTVRKSCQVFNAGPPPSVDMVWVVYESSSAGAAQTALIELLNSSLTTQVTSKVDVAWRFGFATPSVNVDGGNLTASGWLADLPSLTAAMRSADGGVRTGGSVERGLLAAQTFKSTFPMRPDADVHVVFATAADDATPDLLPAVFNANMASNVASFTAHGFVCPENTNCGAGAIQSTGRYQSVVRDTSGVLASLSIIKSSTEVRPTAYLLEQIAKRSGHRLSLPLALPFTSAFPTNPSGVCNTASVSAPDGCIYDEREQRLSLSGDCRASSGQVVVRSMLLEAAAPASTCEARCATTQVCVTGQCVCGNNCSNACPASTVCNTSTCRCEVR